MGKLNKKRLCDYDGEYWHDLVADDLIWLYHDIKWDIKNLESIKQATMPYKGRGELGGKAEIIHEAISQIVDVYAELSEAIWDLWEIAK